MPVDRTIFDTFTLSRTPSFLCPDCGNRTLFLELEESDNKLAWRGIARWMWPSYKPYEDEEFLFYASPFHAWARCHSQRCYFLSSVQGVADSDFEQDEYGNYHEFHHFKVTGFSHAPLMINHQPNTPELVKNELRKAESLIWIDPASTSSRLRSALERLMDNKKIPRFSRVKQKKLRRKDLKERLELYRPKDQKFQSIVHAVRWIGNSGTHEDVQLSDALDAFDLLEYVLDQEFNPHADQLSRKAGKINKRKKPLSK